MCWTGELGNLSKARGVVVGAGHLIQRTVVQLSGASCGVESTSGVASIPCEGEGTTRWESRGGVVGKFEEEASARVRLLFVRSQVRFPAKVDTSSAVVVGELPIMSGSSRAVKFVEVSYSYT